MSNKANLLDDEDDELYEELTKTQKVEEIAIIHATTMFENTPFSSLALYPRKLIKLEFVIGEYVTTIKGRQEKEKKTPARS